MYSNLLGIVKQITEPSKKKTKFYDQAQRNKKIKYNQN